MLFKFLVMITSMLIFGTAALVTPGDFLQAQEYSDLSQTSFQGETLMDNTDTFREQEWARCEAMVAGECTIELDLWTVKYNVKCDNNPLNPFHSPNNLAADHLIELQTVVKAFELSGRTLGSYSHDNQWIILEIVNGSKNMRYLPADINKEKGRIVTSLINGIKDIDIEDCPEVKIDNTKLAEMVQAWVNEFQDQMASTATTLQHALNKELGKRPPIAELSDLINRCIIKLDVNQVKTSTS